MSKDQSPRGQGFWLTAGEIVGALALMVAGLNLWESHQQRVESTRRAEGEDKARAAFVAQGHAERQGRNIKINPLSASQVITSQRYVFPRPIQSSTEDVTASEPRIDTAWVATGLGRSVEARRLKGPGHGRFPVVIETTYVEDGETRSDVSLYEIGYDWRPKFLGGEQVRLEGIALAKRGLNGDARKLADAAWAQASIPDRLR